MATQTIDGIEIAYETTGPAEGRPLVLIMGLATSSAAWPDEFCGMLADSGHFVVRFDNRDVGLSGKLESAGEPDLEALMADLMAGKAVQPPYTLEDMASDTLGLMDALGIRRGHICGISMGGMIGQVMAIHHPERLASLTSIMSTTGEPNLPPSLPAASRAMMGMPPDTREAYQDYLVDIMRLFSSDSPYYDAEWQRRQAGVLFDRGFYPAGFSRQMAAIIASGSRRRRLQEVRVPTLVIHGDHDAVLPQAHGKDTAAAIPHADFLLVRGMGHALAYPDLWPQIVQAISAHTTEAENRSPITERP